MNSQQQTQEHLNETRTVLQTLENVQRYAQTEGKQTSALPSTINTTIQGLREYIQSVEANGSFIAEALQQAPQTRSAGTGSQRGS